MQWIKLQLVIWEHIPPTSAYDKVIHNKTVIIIILCEFLIHHIQYKNLFMSLRTQEILCPL